MHEDGAMQASVVGSDGIHQCLILVLSKHITQCIDSEHSAVSPSSIQSNKVHKPCSYLSLYDQLVSCTLPILCKLLFSRCHISTYWHAHMQGLQKVVSKHVWWAGFDLVKGTLAPTWAKDGPSSGSTTSTASVMFPKSICLFVSQAFNNGLH